jgi:hypothetical protein
MNSGPESSPPVAPPPGPRLTPDGARLPPRSKQPRESKSIAIPVLKPSLIPFDVLKAHQDEQAAAARVKLEVERAAPPVLLTARQSRERFFERFFVASGLVSQIDAAGRARLFEGFAEKRLGRGEVVVFEGEVANLAALVLEGELALEDRTRVGQNANRFALTRGHFVVVTSAMLGVPSRFKITAPVPSTVLMLGHLKLAQLLNEYPALARLPQLLPSAMRQLDRDLFWDPSGQALA